MGPLGTSQEPSCPHAWPGRGLHPMAELPTAIIYLQRAAWEPSDHVHRDFRCAARARAIRKRTPEDDEIDLSARPIRPGPWQPEIGTLTERHLTLGIAPALLANLLIIGAIGAYALLDHLDPDLFYRSVQEDEWLEWATVWAFLAGTLVFGQAAGDQWKSAQKLPWFLGGVALFCFLVAMEEISWGQRLIGYRPPAYFLENNFQQEFNLHNVMDTDLRILGVQTILLGYGVALPLIALIPVVRRFLRGVAIEAPPAALIPAFIVGYVVYQEYPLSFTGEIVELMMGLGFCFAGIAAREFFRDEERPALRQLRAIAVASSAIALLGLGNTMYTQMSRSTSPDLLRRAEIELDALRDDFVAETRRRRGRPPTKCGLHKRLYSFQEKYDGTFLQEGRFAALVEQGMPAERAEFLLDPWNYPYWIRDNCDGDRITFVYSFGPNRLRDSTRREIRYDDMGSVLRGAVRTPGRRAFEIGDESTEAD